MEHVVMIDGARTAGTEVELLDNSDIDLRRRRLGGQRHSRRAAHCARPRPAVRTRSALYA